MKLTKIPEIIASSLWSRYKIKKIWVNIRNDTNPLPRFA